MSKCKKCGAEIIWIRSTKTGKMMPLNAERNFITLDIAKGEAFVTDSGDVVRGHRTDDPEKAWGTARTSHFATCPFAAEFRKR